jgi:hypothetical protein
MQWSVKAVISISSGTSSARNLSAHYSLRECLKAPVVGLLYGIWKTTGRQLLHLQMIIDAFAAHSFARARFIAAVAALHIPGFVAFHQSTSMF